MLSKLKAWINRLRAWICRANNCICSSRSLHLLLIAIVIGTIIIVPLWAFKYFQVVGPVIGALISIIAVLGNEAARYCSSTSNLRLSLGLEGEKSDPVIDPGLDVEVFGSQDCRRYRVSAMVINDGKAVIRDAKASLTIKVRKGNQVTHYLGDVLIRRNDFSKYQGNQCVREILNSRNCMDFLVNEYNPHVIGETLAWALPEKIIIRPNVNPVNIGLPIPWPITDYQHITSISPGQRNRLLIFEFMKLSNNEYLVMPFSEYGAPGPSDPSIRPYRACLRLDKDHELIFDITVHSEGARSPLSFSLCIDIDKLAGLENAVTNLENAVRQGRGVEQAFNNLLQALNKLKC